MPTYPNGGLTLGANVTNYVSDGDAGFTNSGTMTIGGQNTSGTNTYANPIILGWTPNRGKSVTLVAATGGQVDFTGRHPQQRHRHHGGRDVGDATHAGIVKLAGANTYAGDTKIVNGALVVSGSLATGTVTVQSGGSLGGTGTINGPVVVQSGGLLSPGDPLGTLTVTSSLSFAPGSQVRMDINAGSSASDKVIGLYQPRLRRHARGEQPSRDGAGRPDIPTLQRRQPQRQLQHHFTRQSRPPTWSGSFNPLPVP